MLIRDVWKPFLDTICHDRYTGQNNELTLKEIIKKNIKLKKVNGEEKYFTFFY